MYVGSFSVKMLMLYSMVLLSLNTFKCDIFVVISLWAG